MSVSASDEAVLRNIAISAPEAARRLGKTTDAVLQWRFRHHVQAPKRGRPSGVQLWHGCRMTCPEHCPYNECMVPTTWVTMPEDKMRARAAAAMDEYEQRKKKKGRQSK